VALIMGLLFVLGLYIFSSFAARWFPVIWAGLSIFYLLLVGLMNGRRGFTARTAIALLAPRLILMAIFLALAAVRGPQYFWYLFWTSDLFRTVFLSVVLMLVVRKVHIYVVLVRKWGRRSAAGSLALVTMAAGIQWLAAGALLYLFGLEKSITLLNNELLILPAGLSKIMGITTHLGIPSTTPQRVMTLALVLTLLASILFLFNRRIRPQ
jgi:hypothetical protein